MISRNSLLLLSCVCLATLPAAVSGFAAENNSEGGWKTRPAVPELEQPRTPDNPEIRQRWDALRFVQQSSKFVSLPFQEKQQRTVQPGDVLWQAGSDSNDFTMSPLDDVVMGGVSSSTFDGNTGKWTGTVTDANNGGFIGIRSTPTFEWDMTSCKGLEWKVKTTAPNAKRFKFVLRDSTDFNGITWTTSADIAGTRRNPLLDLFPQKQGTSPPSDSGGAVTTVKVPFDELIPALFARTVPDQTFRKDNVVGLQVAFSKFEYDGDLNPKFELGGVDLQLLDLRAY